MAKIASLVLLVLTVAAASILAPTDAAGAFDIAARMAKILKNWKEPIEGSFEIFKTTIEINNMDMHDGVLPRRGNDAAVKMVPILGFPVATVQAGGTSFLVAGVDVTSTVTWTSRCGGGGKPVPCGDLLCDHYGECSGGGRACNSSTLAGVPLYEGTFVLSGPKGSNSTFYACQPYACRPNAPTGGDDYAVIGLGRGSNILSENDTFSYILDGDLQGSTVWVGYDAIVSENAAAQAGRRSTTGLGPDTASRFYYVGIAGIKAGSSGEVGGGEEPVADGIMTTTIPFTFLKQVLFDHLEKQLSAVASPVSSNNSGLGQLCYPSDTELPAVTLVFAAAGKDAADAEMELQPEHYSYRESSGVVCLSILPSPWASGGSVIGSMVQAGRRMTYKLDDNTLTFDVAASSASSEPSPLASSSSSAAQAKLTPFYMSHALLLLLAIM